VYIRYIWQGDHHTYGHTRCVYTVLANSIDNDWPFFGGGCSRQGLERRPAKWSLSSTAFGHEISASIKNALQSQCNVLMFFCGGGLPACLTDQEACEKWAADRIMPLANFASKCMKTTDTQKHKSIEEARRTCCKGLVTLKCIPGRGHSLHHECTSRIKVLWHVV
jgi:hypothetical protein